METQAIPRQSWLPFAPLVRFSCALWGHLVDNEVFRRAPGRTRRCRCGAEYLGEDGSRTHVRHTLSCLPRNYSRTLPRYVSSQSSDSRIRSGRGMLWPVS